MPENDLAKEYISEWQYKDETNGLIFPWYTKPFLDELKTWELEDKIVWEYGIGTSSIWWANKCFKLYGVDSDPNWFGSVFNNVGQIANIVLREDPERYVNAIYDHNFKFDIIVIDGIERDECVKPAIDRLKEDGVLIIDNWDQPSVWMPNEHSKNLLKDFECTIFKQPDHYDWQTLLAKR